MKRNVPSSEWGGGGNNVYDSRLVHAVNFNSLGQYTCEYSSIAIPINIINFFYNF